VGGKQKRLEPATRGLDHVDRALANAAGRSEYRNPQVLSATLGIGRSWPNVREIAGGGRHGGGAEEAEA
jgi:hypothetical protein